MSCCMNSHNMYMNLVCELNAIQRNVNYMRQLESHMRAPLLLTLLNSMRKSVKMLGKPATYIIIFLSVYRLFIKIIHEHPCNIGPVK